MLKLRQVAKILGTHHTTIWRQAKSGELESIKVGATYRIDRSTVEAILGRELRQCELEML